MHLLMNVNLQKKIKKCSVNEVSSLINNGRSRLESYLETFSNDLTLKFLNKLGAKSVSKSYYSPKGVLITEDGNVTIQCELYFNVYLDVVKDGCDPYEDSCYLIETTHDYTGNEYIDLSFGIDVD